MKSVRYLSEKIRASRISLSHKFMIGTTIVVTLIMVVTYYFITKKHEDIIIRQIHNQARSLFKQLILTRRWFAEHGGFYVPADATSDSTMLTASEKADGKVNLNTQNNPATFIKELSRYAEEEGLYWFRTTSLKLMNPDNRPDEFERTALIEFEKGGLKESSRIEQIGSKSFYRYIAPLYIEPPCLDCHTRQGYKTGDVRGALSIAIPMDFSYSILRTERGGMVLTGITTILSLMLILYIMMRKLVISPLSQISTSIREFSERGSLDVSTVRTGDELEDLSMSFATMSRSLKEYHSHLEDMVHAATKDLENANERLVALNRMKSDFVAKVSHELRTPLTSIQGAMDYLSARFSAKISTDQDMNEIMSFITVIKKNAGRLVRMVNDTLDLERIESGALDMHFSQIAILNLINEVITTFQSITNEKKISFRVIASPETVVLADEDRIRQVMINLISNSITASPPESEIEITVSESEREVRTSVADRGRGIPAEERDRVFDKFYTRGSKDGSGLGLAICKGIVEAHEGRIWIEERSDGTGCAFIFTLPIPGKAM